VLAICMGGLGLGGARLGKRAELLGAVGAWRLVVVSLSVGASVALLADARLRRPSTSWSSSGAKLELERP
jgi:hypothetical protein